MFVPRPGNSARWLAVAALAAGAFMIPLAVRAQDLPSYAQPVYASTDETIRGRISSVDGAFNISLNDDRGFIDNVRLHAGTIINPTGLSLAPGMSVTILGVNAGSVFDANEIDTPYTYGGPSPEPVYYGPGYWYPGFGYGFGPAFCLAIVIGDGNRFEHHRFYGRPWDGQRYFGAFVGGEPRGFIGERRSEHGFIGERRSEHSFIGERRSEHGQVPSAFSGRSFAGRSFAAAPGPATTIGGSRYSTHLGNPGRRFSEPAVAGNASTRSGFVRSAPPGGGSMRSTPAGGAFVRSARSGGGFVRSAPSGGGSMRSAGSGGGFVRSAPSGGFARGSSAGFARAEAGMHGAFRR